MGKVRNMKVIKKVKDLCFDSFNAGLLALLHSAMVFIDNGKKFSSRIEDEQVWGTKIEVDAVEINDIMRFYIAISIEQKYYVFEVGVVKYSIFQDTYEVNIFRKKPGKKNLILEKIYSEIIEIKENHCKTLHKIADIIGQKIDEAIE